MKHFLIVVLFLASGSALLAQSSEKRDVGPFKGIKAAEGIDVYLKKGDKESVRVEAVNPNANRIITEVSDGYLKIHMKDGSHNKIDVKVYVTYVNIEKIYVSSAASVFSDGPIKGKSMDINVSSAGEIKISLEVEKARINASSAGEVEVKGKVTTLTAEASSAGEIDAFDLEAENVTAEASSAGSVQVNVKSSFTAQASTGGDVRYRGNPDKSVTNSSSGGSVKKTN